MLDVEQGGRDRASDADPDHAVNAAVHHVKSIAESTRSVIPISETRPIAIDDCEDHPVLTRPLSGWSSLCLWAYYEPARPFLASEGARESCFYVRGRTLIHTSPANLPPARSE
jgi:hypothetical protein